MELYGSIQSISGSMTASVFTGSFKGDGSGLYGISATGVTGLNLSQISTGSVTASVSPDGLNVNSDTSITGTLRVTGTIVAEQIDVTIYSSSVLYQSGSTRFGDTLDDVHNITGSVNITGSISLNGQAIGTGKLDETTFQSYTSSNDDRVSALETSSGSLNSFTSSIDTTIKNKLNTEGVISGSIQVEITGTTGYSTFSSSIATTDSNQESRLTSLESASSSIRTDFNSYTSSNDSTNTLQNSRLDALQTTTSSLNSFTSSIDTTIKNKLNTEAVVSSSVQVIEYGFATTGSNLFIGTQTLSGSILPSVDNEYDLGSPQYQWRDVYISSGSLYIDGTKVISSTTQELQITTDSGQSIKILEGGTDSIILQTADGDIELKSNADGDILLDPTNGKILLKGTVEVLSGNKIQSSVGGTPVVFANDIVVSGSIELTGTIDGIDLTAFSSSVNTRLSNIESSSESLNSFTSSASSRLSAIEIESGSVRTNLNSYTSSTDTRLSSIETTTGSIITTNSQQTGRLDSIEEKTGSYATTGSNSFNGNQTITGSLTITDNLSVLGSSSIIYSTASQLIVEDNVIVVNASYPAERFAGLEIHDSGSNGSITASLFWDGLNNRFIYRNTSDAHYGGAMFIGGPRNTGSLGDEPSLTSGRVPKSIGGDHIGDSIINETNGSIGISGSLVITGSILSTDTSLVSGSSQISFNGITDKPTLVSGSSQISFNTISDKPTLVSGSSQISYSGLSDIPSGIVSGSSQISFNNIADKPTLVSGSAQIDLTSTTNYSTGIKTRLNAENVISGSVQVIAALPSGTVSGSAQIVLSGTTGFSTYLNQAVLTTSSPSFAGLTTTGAIGAGYSTTSEPFIQGHFYNTSTTSGTQYGGVLVSGLSQAHIRFQVGTNSWGAGGAKQWQIRVGDGSGADNMKIYSWTYGGDILTLSSNAAATFASTVTATSFIKSSGTSSQFLKADGSVDSSTYLTSYTETDTLATVTARGATTSTDLTFNGALTMGTSGTQYIRMGRFPSSVTNTGEAWIGRASDRSAGTMTVQLGSGSDRTFEVVDNAWSTVIFGASMSAFTYKNNTILHAGNYTSYAMAGAGYSANQNLNTSNTPTFAGANLTDRLYLNGGSYEGSILFGSSTTWRCGIRQHDDADAELRIWTVNNNGMIFLANGYNGEPADIARPTDGLVVGPGNNVGIGNFSSSDPGYKLQVNGTGYFSGNVRMNANVGVGGDAALKFHVYGSNEFVRFENTSTGGNQYCQLNMRAGSRNSYIWVGNENTSAWAGAGGLNIYTDSGNMDFWTNTVQRVRIQSDGHMVPFANNTYDLGSSSLGWRNVYTNDLHLSNMNKPEGNDVDGTNGNWTIQEGAENLYIINNNNGKKFKIKLEEI